MLNLLFFCTKPSISISFTSNLCYHSLYNNQMQLPLSRLFSITPENVDSQLREILDIIRDCSAEQFRKVKYRFAAYSASSPGYQQLKNAIKNRQNLHSFYSKYQGISISQKVARPSSPSTIEMQMPRFSEQQNCEQVSKAQRQFSQFTLLPSFGFLTTKLEEQQNVPSLNENQVKYEFDMFSITKGKRKKD